MNFHVVRSTKAVTFSPSVFLGDPAYRHSREPWHVKNHPDYPDANYYLNHIQKYYFRHPDLRHLRHEQFNRYLYFSGEHVTNEDTVAEEGEGTTDDPSHRNSAALSVHLYFSKEMLLRGICAARGLLRQLR